MKNKEINSILRKSSFLSIIIIFFYTSFSQNNCTDTSKNIRLLTNNRFSLINFDTIENNNMILVGSIDQETQQAPTRGFIIQNDEIGRNLWAKAVRDKKDYYYIKFKRVEQLKNGDYIVLGVAGNSIPYRLEHILMLRFTKSGDLVWQSVLKLPILSTIIWNEGVTEIEDIVEDINGDIFFPILLLLSDQ